MSSDERIIDTVVLLYFLLVGQEQLLCVLLGDPLRVPIAVYDPDDRSLPEPALRRSELLSEMRQAIRHYEVATRTGGAVPESLERVRRVDELYDVNRLAVVEMTDDELAHAAQLQSGEGAAEHDLSTPLGSGEAACVAIAWQRGCTVVTDDSDALTVLDDLHGGRTYGYERIRKLLMRAASENLITRTEANQIHEQMRALGFWDTGPPFRSHESPPR